jgi:hypothetical protein
LKRPKGVQERICRRVEVYEKNRAGSSNRTKIEHRTTEDRECYSIDSLGSSEIGGGESGAGESPARTLKTA